MTDMQFKIAAAIVCALPLMPITILGICKLIALPFKVRAARRQAAMQANSAANGAAQNTPAQPAQPKRPRGRPRKNPAPSSTAQPAQPKRPRGRPRKNPLPPSPSPAAQAAPQQAAQPAPHVSQSAPQAHSAPNSAAQAVPQPQPLPPLPLTYDVKGNNMLRGHVVALPAVQDAALPARITANGGAVYNGQYAATLIVMNNAAVAQLNAIKQTSPAAKIIGLSELEAMLNAPLTFSDPAQLIAWITSRTAQASAAAAANGSTP